MELFVWTLGIQLLFAGDKPPQFQEFEMSSREECLEAAAKILEHSPTDFHAKSLGAACFKDVKEKVPENPA